MNRSPQAEDDGFGIEWRRLFHRDFPEGFGILRLEAGIPLAPQAASATSSSPRKRFPFPSSPDNRHRFGGNRQNSSLIARSLFISSTARRKSPASSVTRRAKRDFPGYGPPPVPPCRSGNSGSGSGHCRSRPGLRCSSGHRRAATLPIPSSIYLNFLPSVRHRYDGGDVSRIALQAFQKR